MIQSSMLKTKAIELLGGSVSTAAAAIGISYQAVAQWPEELPRRISDRVLAAIARKRLALELDGESATPKKQAPQGHKEAA